MSFLAKIYYSIKTICVLSVGWLISPQTYKQYVNAWLIVNENPELANNILKNYEQINISSASDGGRH